MKPVFIAILLGVLAYVGLFFLFEGIEKLIRHTVEKRRAKRFMQSIPAESAENNNQNKEN